MEAQYSLTSVMQDWATKSAENDEVLSWIIQPGKMLFLHGLDHEDESGPKQQTRTVWIGEDIMILQTFRNPGMKWTDGQMAKFVHLYKIHPCLWKTDLPEYKVKTARVAALKNIVSEMNIPNFSYLDCKIKIKNVRSHYCQELKKIRNSMYKDSLNIYTPTLSWFDALDSYLRDYVVHKPEPDHEILHIDLPSFKDEAHEQPAECSPPLLSPPSPATSGASFERPSTPESNVHSVSASVKSKRKRRAEYSFEVTQQNVGSASSGYKKSEFDIFGESVAAQLSSMQFIDALKLQLKIQELITRERLISINRGRVSE